MDTNGKKAKSVKQIVIKGFGLGMLMSILLTILGEIFIIFFINMGYIKPANYLEKMLPQVIEDIHVKGFDKKLLPEGYYYAVYDKQLNFIEGNIKNNKNKIIKENLKEGKDKIYFNLGKVQIRVIQDKDKKVALLYTITAKYSNSYLDRVLPPIELFMVSIPFVSVAIAFNFVVHRISNRFKKGIKGLIEAADKVGKQELSFNLNTNYIKEIDLLNQAFENMACTLQNSLKAQWKLEDERKLQISAIVHDVKTPLMLTSGYADLLLETENLSEEQKNYTNYILKGTNQISDLLDAILQSSGIESTMKANMEKVDVVLFIEEIRKQSDSLCKLNGINLIFKVEAGMKEVLYFDKILVERAVLNIINNGIRYTPKGRELNICIKLEKDKFVFEVKDNGRGFSKKDLIYSKEQFYRGDSSRKRNGHYGLGLYIANKIAKLHEGELSLKNHNDGGAIVKLTI